MEALNLDPLTFTALLYTALFVILELVIVFILYVLRKKSDYKILSEKMDLFKTESSFFKKTYARGSYPILLTADELNLLHPDFINQHQHLLENLYVKHFFRNSKVFLIYELAQVIRDIKDKEKIKNDETRKITRTTLQLAMSRNSEVFASFIIKTAEFRLEKLKILLNKGEQKDDQNNDSIYQETQDIIEVEAFIVSIFKETEEDVSLLNHLKKKYENDNEIKEIIEALAEKIGAPTP